MIVCVSPNPAIDRHIFIPGFAQGGVFRPKDILVTPGGKGINVVRAIYALGGQAINTGFLAGHAGNYIAEHLEKEGLASRWTRLNTSETRINIIFVDPEQDLTTVSNEQGPPVTDADWHNLETDILAAAEEATFISFSGSVPPGTTPETFTSVLAKLRDAGHSVWVDTSGAMLEATAQVPGISIKVNDLEMAVLLGREIKTEDELAQACADLQKRQNVPVAVTRGAKGAILATAEGVWMASAPAIDARNAVGSGDSFLSGLLVGLEKKLSSKEALAYGVAAGTANALSMGGGHFTYADFSAMLEQTQAYSLREH